MHLADFVPLQSPRHIQIPKVKPIAGVPPAVLCPCVHVVDDVVRQPEELQHHIVAQRAVQINDLRRPPHESRVVRLAQQREIIRQRRKIRLAVHRIVELKPRRRAVWVFHARPAVRKADDRRSVYAVRRQALLARLGHLLPD